MELRMVLKWVQLYTMDTLGVESASGSWLGPSGPTLECLIVLLPQGVSCCPGGPFCFDLQHVLKCFLFPLMTFLAPCWAFSRWMRHAAFTACLTWATLGSVAIAFPELEGLDLVYGWWFYNSTIGFVSVESLTVILCSLACWRRAWYVMSSLLFFSLTHFLTSKCFVAWRSNSVLHTIFSASVWYWNFSTRSLICWSNWSVDSCSPCLMSLYNSSMWFQYEVNTSRVLVIALKTSCWMLQGLVWLGLSTLQMLVVGLLCSNQTLVVGSWAVL